MTVYMKASGEITGVLLPGRGVVSAKRADDALMGLVYAAVETGVFTAMNGLTYRVQVIHV